MRQREQRYRVRVTARMRTEQGWADVVIKNVSSHGMLLQSSTVPRTGSYIEIRRDAMVVVARAVWAKDGTCGIRTQDLVDIPALCSKAPVAPRQLDGAKIERRRAPRDVAAAGERARLFGRAFQFAAATVAVIAAATVVAGALYETLATPARAIRMALAGAG